MSNPLEQDTDGDGLSDYLLKTRNRLELTGDTLNIPASVWKDGPCGRGDYIDEFMNKHSLGKGLGQYFPVADRLQDRVLISTKSLDIATQGYQNPAKLKSTLEKYANSLKNIEKNYFNAEGVLKWRDYPELSINAYDKKALEIVLPDIMITEDSLKVLNEFKKSMENSEFEVWYRVTK